MITREKKEFLLVAQRDKISRIDLKDNSLEVLPVLNLKNVITIEFDMKNNCVYWADITLDIIGVGNSKIIWLTHAALSTDL